MRSPSSLNTQPWNVYVVTGEPLERIRAENTRRNLERIPSTREFRGMENYEGVHRERQVGIAKQLFGAMGIARDDKPKRTDWVLRGFRQFDAPACIVRSEEHTSELQSLMRISYAVFCLKKKNELRYQQR